MDAARVAFMKSSLWSFRLEAARKNPKSGGYGRALVSVHALAAAAAGIFSSSDSHALKIASESLLGVLASHWLLHLRPN